MKTQSNQSTTSSNSHAQSAPFFKKNAEDTFFPLSKMAEKPFFQKKSKESPPRVELSTASSTKKEKPHLVDGHSPNPHNIIQCSLESRAEIHAEIRRMTGATSSIIPAETIRTLLLRLRLRRSIIRLQQRRAAHERRYVRCFPDGNCGFWGTTQSEYTSRDSALLDQIFAIRRGIYRQHREPVAVGNVRLAITDPLGQEVNLEEAIRIAETTYTFDEGSVFQTQTRFESVRQFPNLPQERPHDGLVYLFIAVTRPSDIKPNNIAAARTARDAVRSNTRIFLQGTDRADIARVSSIQSFIRLIRILNTACQRNNLKIRQIEMFSHGGLDGPIFGDNRQQFGLHGAPPLSSLPQLSYTGDAIVFFRGCRVGAGQFLSTFAAQQGVATYGFEGSTSFSTRPRSFYAWGAGSPAYQLDFPGSETWSQVRGRHPQATPPVGVVPRQSVVSTD